MLGAAFATLTTSRSPVLKSGSLTSLTAVTAAPEAEHPQGQRAAKPIKLHRPRR